MNGLIAKVTSYHTTKFEFSELFKMTHFSLKMFINTDAKWLYTCGNGSD